MHTKYIYYLILFVYLSLWSCQVVACHLTHSLIILTDSYINLYKILDISLGILHLHTQNEVKRLGASASSATGGERPEVHLFGWTCSYRFKRLPVVGAFVNRLFLAALLVSAAIEGIQTCFHASHLAAESDTSILLEHPLTYPVLLVGFALVGLLMQWSSNKAHRLREDELESVSLLGDVGRSEVRELSVQQLRFPKSGPQIEKRHSVCLGNPLSTKRFEFSLTGRRRSGFGSVPTDLSEAGKVSLRSLKLIPEFANQNLSPATVSFISGDTESRGCRPSSGAEHWRAADKWRAVRYCASPVALLICALLVYHARQGSFSIDNRELVAEFADATLAILVVSLLFTASYPPMKRAGKVLLQSVPEELDLGAIEARLKSANQLIVDIRELHVWSLTATSNRVATCHIVLNRDDVRDEGQLALILNEVRCKFLEDNINCSTIQPVFLESSISN